MQLFIILSNNLKKRKTNLILNDKMLYMISKNIDQLYFRKYRALLGFANQNDTKQFFGAKDIQPSVDLEYINKLNIRLCDIVKNINQIVPAAVGCEDVDKFNKRFINDVFKIMLCNDIISKLNNQGRRSEEVYFSWMRGYVIANYFKKSLSNMFGVALDDIKTIGDDDFKESETFKRTPKADLEIDMKEVGKVRLEIQSGFQGTNDIKQHKVLEAKKARCEDDLSATLIIHFDIYNGQVAIVRIDNISDDNINWITRQQMEGQTVFNIDQNYFVWKLTEECPTLEEIKGLIRENE